jgi:hypothetical protein
MLRAGRVGRQSVKVERDGKDLRSKQRTPTNIKRLYHAPLDRAAMAERFLQWHYWQR